MFLTTGVTKVKVLKVQGVDVQLYQHWDQKVFRVRDIHKWFDNDVSIYKRKMKNLDDDQKFCFLVDTPGGMQWTNFVNVNGLRDLIKKMHGDFYKELLNQLIKIV